MLPMRVGFFISMSLALCLSAIDNFTILNIYGLWAKFSCVIASRRSVESRITGRYLKSLQHWARRVSCEVTIRFPIIFNSIA